MSPQTPTKQRRYVASLALIDAHTDIILSRQAMQCSPATLQLYRYTAGSFLDVLQARHVREHLAQLVGAGKSDTTLHDHARAIKSLLRFWHAEGYLPAPITFAMPRLQQKGLPMLTADQLKQVLSSGLSSRDLALIVFIADSGLRRAEYQPTLATRAQPAASRLGRSLFSRWWCLSTEQLIWNDPSPVG